MVSIDREFSTLDDRKLEGQVTAYLRGCQVPALRRVAVEAEHGTVTLRGEVTSFYQKQLCIHGCTRLPGVVDVVDEVEVVGLL